MSDIVIKAEHLSKYYRLGVVNHGMLYKDIQSWMARKLGKEDPHGQIGQDHFADRPEGFWALKDLNFEIKRGDRVGIIGKNGAGKSTLLKILSRITAPTEGQVKIRGRVASLLEVGTGFHGELTGRENIFLNGAILGMKRREIASKLDEIIDFSEISQYIDTPVKRYSSGMYVRLAFAVAAHLDSEILIADEVLAVGDASFQKKALGKMQDLSAGQGRTVLFVSHQMNAVGNLCTSGIILERGKIAFQDDDIERVIAIYQKPDSGGGDQGYWESNDPKGNAYFTPLRMQVTNGESTPSPTILRGDDKAAIILDFNIEEINSLLNIGLTISREDGSPVYTTWIRDVDTGIEAALSVGHNRYRINLPASIMNIGEYAAVLHAGLHHTAFIIPPGGGAPSLRFSVVGSIGTDFGDDTRKGAILPLISWTKEQ